MMHRIIVITATTMMVAVITNDKNADHKNRNDEARAKIITIVGDNNGGYAMVIISRTMKTATMSPRIILTL